MNEAHATLVPGGHVFEAALTCGDFGIIAA
jgi:hypothetical protein